MKILLQYCYYGMLIILLIGGVVFSSLTIPNYAEIEQVEIEVNDVNLQKSAGSVFYKNKTFNGYLVKYEKTKLISKAEYIEGMRSGEAVQYYNNGTLKERRFYIDNKKQGNHQGWWDSGQLKFNYHFKDGLHEGSAQEWFHDGSPFRFFNYKNGKEEGAQKMWEGNGSIRANYVVVEGRRFGLIGLKNCKSVKDRYDKYEAISY